MLQRRLTGAIVINYCKKESVRFFTVVQDNTCRILLDIRRKRQHYATQENG